MSHPPASATIHGSRDASASWPWRSIDGLAPNFHSMDEMRQLGLRCDWAGCPEKLLDEERWLAHVEVHVFSLKRGVRQTWLGSPDLEPNRQHTNGTFCFGRTSRDPQLTQRHTYRSAGDQTVSRVTTSPPANGSSRAQSSPTIHDSSAYRPPQSINGFPPSTMNETPQPGLRCGWAGRAEMLLDEGRWLAHVKVDVFALKAGVRQARPGPPELDPKQRHTNGTFCFCRTS